MPHSALRPSRAPDPLIGETLDGRYRVLSRIGAGGMGVVYLAEHVLIGRKFALKVMSPHSDLPDELLERFQREAMAAASVGNGHVVDVTDMGMADDGRAYLVLEYLEGSDLAKVVAEDGPFSVERAIHVVLQLCDALGAVHAKRIVHRDLKPENIMLITRAGDPDFVKVLDFGICKLLEPAARTPGGRVTATHASLGTPQFMAPEQFRGSARVDERADIHAVGAILYFMLTGKVPYEADDLAVLLMRVCTEAPPSARMLRPDLPPALDHVIKTACAKRASERYANSDELALALAPFGIRPFGKTAPYIELRPRDVRASDAPGLQASPTANSWPPSADPAKFLPPPVSMRVKRVAAWGLAIGCVLSSFAAFGTRRQAQPTPRTEAAETPRDAGSPTMTAELPAASDQTPVGQAVLAMDPAQQSKGTPRRGHPAALRVRPARADDVPETTLAGGSTEHAGTPPREADPTPAPAPSPPPPAPSVDDELARYRYPQRNLRDVY